MNNIEIKNNKIILISHEMTYTGAPRSLLNICIILKKIGKNITVYTLENGPFQNEFERVGIEVNKYSDNCLGNISYSDIVILNTIFTAPLCKKIKFLTGARVYLFIREAKNLSTLMLSCGIDENNITCADEVLCVSKYAATYIERYSPKKLIVLHNYVRDYYKISLNLVENNIINYLISGTYEERKGVDIAVQAFLKMPMELKEKTQLHIVGPTPDFSKNYQEYVRGMYDGRIIEHGEIRDEIERINLYNKMNVFLVPSKDESCSLVALEGAMLGKVIIISENVGASYVCGDSRWIFKTDDIYDLCRKMCNATSRKELIVEGIRNRSKYRKSSTEKVFTKNLFKIIN